MTTNSKFKDKRRKKKMIQDDENFDEDILEMMDGMKYF